MNEGPKALADAVRLRKHKEMLVAWKPAYFVMYDAESLHAYNDAAVSEAARDIRYIMSLEPRRL